MRVTYAYGKRSDGAGVTNYQHEKNNNKTGIHMSNMLMGFRNMIENTQSRMGNIQKDGEVDPATNTHDNQGRMPPEAFDGESLKELQALKLINEGRIDEARNIYRKLIKMGSSSPDVFTNLGTILKIRGDIKQAITCFEQAIAIEPKQPEAHNNLGVALKEQGDLNTAIIMYNNAIKLKYNYPEAHYNLGNAFQERGDVNASIVSFHNALKLQHEYPEAHFNLGNALLEKGDLDNAIVYYLNALKLKQNYPEALNNLGIALKDQGNPDAAIAACKNALKLEPNNAKSFCNLGSALQEKNHTDAALSCYTKTLELEPENSYAYYGIGRVQTIKGEIAESKISLGRAVELNPNNTSALYELTKIMETESHLIELTKKLKNVSREQLNTREKSMLEFGLANLYHKSREYTQAAKHLEQANQLKLLCQPSDLEARLLNTNRSLDSAKEISEGNPLDGTGRIFIVGVPRCGSTLLESVLATNSKIRCLGETKALSQAVLKINRKNYGRENNSSLAVAYTEETKEALNEYTHTVDKNLYNFKLTEAIVRALPGAKIIHCRRHPLDNILSMLRSNLQVGSSYTANAVDAAKFLARQDNLMCDFKRKYNNKIFEFDYDRFTYKTQEYLEPLIEWLELEWTDAYVHPEKNRRFINTASTIQARQPINNKSVGGWKNYLELLRPAEAVLREFGLIVK